MTQPRLLITDDDETTLAMLDGALQDHYHVVTAHSGKQAIALAREQAFDLILLDVEMPEVDGYETCEALKAMPETAELPVLFLSAHVNTEERLRGYRAGGTDYLAKPFDAAELLTKIQLAVAQKARHEALNGQVEEAMNAAMTTANMYGEVGVVLEMQRKLGHCSRYTEIAQVFFEALAQIGFEGCLRLSGRQGVMSRSTQGDCSALSLSLLDHIERTIGPTIQAVGDNTSLNFGNVVILVRSLPMQPCAEMFGSEEVDRFARARDNIALMAEGIVSRMRALDIETDKSHFERSQRMMVATREALIDIKAQEHANSLKANDIFQRMHAEMDRSFIHLGLTEAQEEQLTTILRRHIDEAMAVFDQSHQIEDHLNRLIGKLHG